MPNERRKVKRRATTPRITERTHTGPQATKSGRAHKGVDRAWKASKYATHDSRLALNVIYYQGVRILGGDKPKERAPHTPWQELLTDLLKMMPQLEDGIMLRDGSGKRPIDVTAYSSRYANFFHVKTEGGWTWSAKDSEHPLNHPELQPLLPKAKALVEEFYGEKLTDFISN